MISGNVSLNGEKMSKSKGNVIDPKTIMEKYGSDAIRYWASSSKLGEDIDYQEKDVITGKKFATKILNASNFAFMNLKHQEKMPKLEETDRLLINELNKTIKIATESLEEFNYSRAKNETDTFFWKTLCDNYLEIVKWRVYNGNEEEKASANYTLYQAILTITKLMAPFTPFITEEIYHEHFAKKEGKKSVHQEEWPELLKIEQKNEDELVWKRMLEIISQVRQKKSEAQKSQKAEIILTITKEDKKLLTKVLEDIKTVCSAKEIKEGILNVQLL